VGRRKEMSRYIIYKDEYNNYIVELLNEGINELYEVEKELIEKGFVIDTVIGIFIKCFKKEGME
jgi:hypothetical protein